MYRVPHRGRIHCARVQLEALEVRQLLATFTVGNANDSGPGSLRQAILDSNADVATGVDRIAFAIPGAGVHTIHLASGLPSITRPVSIDGTTQPSYAGKPLVALDGTHAGPSAGLTVSSGAGGSLILALAVDRFRGDGVDVNGAPGVTIQGCYIGVDATGTTAEGNDGDGILLAGSPGATIAGGNVISGNGGYGIATQTTGIDYPFNPMVSSSLLIRANEIGTDSTVTHALGNVKGGILLDGGATGDTIGGSAAGQGNVISGNGGDGISGQAELFVLFEEFVGVNNELIEGNDFGTDRGATRDLGNLGDGVDLRLGNFGDFAIGNTIGGTAAGAGNTFAFNRGPAIEANLTNIVAGNRIIGGPPSVAIDLSVVGSNAGTRAGDTIHLALTVTNRGPATATNLALGVPGTITSGSTTIPNLAPGASVVIDTDITAVNPDGSGSDSSQVATFSLRSVDQFDSDTSTARVAFPATAANYPLVVVSPVISPSPTVVGQTSTATFTVTNIGNLPTIATNLGLSFLDAESSDSPAPPVIRSVSVSQGTGPDPHVLGYGGLTTTSFGTIAPGDSATLTIEFSPRVAQPVNFDVERAFGQEIRGATQGPNVTGVSVLAAATVTNANDSGPGSLRQAIIDADFDAGGSNGVERIAFAIPGAGVHTIHLASGLPFITRPVSIDGTTQPGYAGTPVVVLDGTHAGKASGISLGNQSDGNTIRGLAIDRFQLDGIHLEAARYVAIRGNYIGVDASGTASAGNGRHGIENLGDFGLFAASHNTIGGMAAGDGNVISGNGQDGIADLGGGSTLIQGNRIGTDASGTHALGNGDAGILLSGTPSETIGGTTAGAGNVISGNANEGIRLMDQLFQFEDTLIGSSDERVEGNFIGTDRSGLLDLGNGGNGITVEGLASGTIGGTTSGSGNVIAHNRGRAILFPFQTSLQHTVVVGNVIGPGTMEADIDVTVSGSNDHARPGDPISYTLTVTNHGPVDATHLRFELARHGGSSPVVIVSGPAIPEEGFNKVDSDIASLAAGASVTIGVRSRASQFNPSNPLPDDFSFTLIGLDQLDPDSTNNSASAPLDASALTDLMVTGGIAPGSQSVGVRQTVAFTVTNGGHGTAAGVALRVAGLPPSAIIDAVRVSQGTGPSPGDFASGTTPVARLGEIGPGASASVSIDFTPTAPGPFTITATPSSSGRNVAPASTVQGTATAAVLPVPEADLSVSGVGPLDSGRVGSDAAFGFRVTNRGPSAATGVYLVLDLTGLTGVSSVEFEPGQVNPIQLRPGYYIASLGTLPSGGSAEVAFDAPTLHVGPLAASAAAGLDQVDLNPSDNLTYVSSAVVPDAQVTNIALQTKHARVDAVQLSFDVPLTKGKAEDLRNYHLSTSRHVGRHGTRIVNVPLHLRSAHYDRKHHEVVIRLARPLPKIGTPIKLVIGGQGSVGLTGHGGPMPIVDPFTVTIVGCLKSRRR